MFCCITTAPDRAFVARVSVIEDFYVYIGLFYARALFVTTQKRKKFQVNCCIKNKIISIALTGFYRAYIKGIL